jgi:hypothetical protein
MSKRQRRREEKRRRHEGHEGLDRSRRLATGAGVTVGATLLMGGAAQAATLTVGTTADPGGAMDCTVPSNTDCTLRQAITDANLDPGSTIAFRSGLSGTITLGSALPAISHGTTLTGPGAAQIAVSGGGAVRVLTVDTDPGEDVAISGLEFSNGSATGRGGGINSIDADLSLQDVVVKDNQATQEGGGVAVNSGSLVMQSSTVSGNASTMNAWGGGLYADSGSGTPMTIRGSTISGNEGGYGGGIYFDYSAPGTLDNSTVYGNTSHNSGGGVYDFGPYDGDPGLTVTASTITHNTADRGGGLACYGATDNSHDLTEPIVRNTIIFGNTAASADAGPDLSCNFPSGATELPGHVPVAFSSLGAVASGTILDQTGPNLIGQDPQLGPLASNGGPTQTQRPAVSSPVIDQGAAFGLGSDQRALGRPVDIPTIPNAAGGDGSDIGAVELQPSELPSNSFTAKVKGKKLLVTVSAAGSVGVADAKAPLSATDSKKKKKRKLFLKASSGSGGPPTITVALRLTKFAKQKLRQKGKLGLKSRITFTPNRGFPSTKNLKLKVKGKKPKK